MTNLNPARAVIEAALSWAHTPSETGKLSVLARACEDYRTALTTKDRVVTILWSEVCEGDQLKSDKNDKLYPVTYVQDLRVTVEVKGKPMSIERPAGQATTVVRGPEGLLRDAFPGTDRIG